MFLLSLLACPAAEDPRCSGSDRTLGNAPVEAAFVDLVCDFDANGYYDTPCSTKSLSLSFTDGTELTLGADRLYVLTAASEDGLMVALFDRNVGGALSDGNNPRVTLWVGQGATDEAGSAPMETASWAFPESIPDCDGCATMHIDAVDEAMAVQYPLGVTSDGQVSLSANLTPDPEQSELQIGSYELHAQATVSLEADDDAVVCDDQVAWRAAAGE